VHEAKLYINARSDNLRLKLIFSVIYFNKIYNLFNFYVKITWGLIKKSLKQHAIWLFLKKKSLDLLPIKYQSPPSKKSQIPKKKSIPPIIIKIKTKKEYRYPLNAQHYIYIWNGIAFFYKFLFTITIVLLQYLNTWIFIWNTSKF